MCVCVCVWIFLLCSWKQHPTKQQLYGNIPQNSSCTATSHKTAAVHPISKTTQIRRARHCWRGNEDIISDVLLRIASHGRADVGRPVRTYLQQLRMGTWFSLEDLPNSMDDRDKWREREREKENWEIRARSTLWWWWWWYIIKLRLKFNFVRAKWLVNAECWRLYASQSLFIYIKIFMYKCKCKQFRPGFELMLPYPFPTTITIAL